MTNREKFKQIYGFEADCGSVCTPFPCHENNCRWWKECEGQPGCPCDGWWDMEYEPIQEAADYEEKGLMIIMGDDGIFREYKDEFDITIHCESQEEQDQVEEILNQKYISKEDFGRWIPVSERLPDTDDEVLCWYEYYHWSKEKGVLPEYGFGQYFKETKAWFGEVANGKDVRVIAWMPLPKPYKAESEDKE